MTYQPVLTSHINEPNSYTLDFYMKNLRGSARFSPWPGGKTLFTYTTHTTPRSPLAGLWRARVPGEVEVAMKATVAFLSNEAGTSRLAARAE